MGNLILEMKNINKSFPGVQALKDVSFSVEKGEVRALVGENGAGKSTLMKVLIGVYKSDSGAIFIDGREVQHRNPLDAQQDGLSIIFQEFNLIPSLSISENIYIGRLAGKRKLVDWKKLNQNAAALMRRLGYKLDVTSKVEDLSVAEMQMVEIAKALSYNAKIIVMDEPSSVLTENELERLFNIILDLKRQGTTVIYISHRLEEIFRICDTVTVLRDGQVISTKKVSETNREMLIRDMVGRELQNQFPHRSVEVGETILKASHLKRGAAVDDVSFDLRKGEILGFAGLIGAGRTETMRLLFGADPIESGTIEFYGKTLKSSSPHMAKKNGIALLPEDRKREGLILDQPIEQNISVVSMDKIKSALRLLSRKKERKTAREFMESLKIKAPSASQRVCFLSGGNQQKVVVAKWLFSDAEVMIFDEPTRGIDVGAKYEIYTLMNQLVENGKSIILVSSDMNEVLSMSDRIVVMRDGKVNGVLEKDQFSSENVLQLAIS